MSIFICDITNNVTWDAIMEATSYIIELSDSRLSVIRTIEIFNSYISLAEIMGILPSADYNIRIKAKDNFGQGNYTDYFPITYKSVAPDPALKKTVKDLPPVFNFRIIDKSFLPIDTFLNASGVTVSGVLG